MPEKFSLPEIKGRPKKSEKDITKGEITEKGVWKSEEIAESEDNLNETTSPKVLREFVPEKISNNQTAEKDAEIVDEINEDVTIIGQKSANVEKVPENNFYDNGRQKFPQRQEDKEAGVEANRRFQKEMRRNLINGELPKLPNLPEAPEDEMDIAV